MKLFYKNYSPQRQGRFIIEVANEIIGEYQQKGFKLTLRQLYYQMVGRGYIGNSDSDYKSVGRIIDKARKAGMIDWDAIEDRTRYLRQLNHFESPQEVIEAAYCSYHTDWWQDQENRVEVWIEKDALVDIIQIACEPWDVPCLSCRGFASSSTLWSMAQRFIRMSGEGQKPIILYLGDHDPAGLQIPVTIAEELALYGADVELRRIALTMEQIEELNPPPYKPKKEDTKSKQYIKRYGQVAWELDALPPQTLIDLVTDEIQDLVDLEAFEAAKWEEQQGLEQLRILSENYDEAMKALLA